MTLTELFLPQTNQEFPPKHVYAYVGSTPEDSQVKSLDGKELSEYNTMYEYAGEITEPSEMWNDKKFSLPLLLPKVVL